MMRAPEDVLVCPSSTPLHQLWGHVNCIREKKWWNMSQYLGVKSKSPPMLGVLCLCVDGSAICKTIRGGPQDVQNCKGCRD